MIRKFLLIGSGVVFALLFSQFLEYRQHYIQRMGGTLEELERQIENLDSRAEETGQTRKEYILHFLASEEKIIRLEGDHMVKMLSRQVTIKQALNKIQQAPGYQQLFVFLLYIDMPVAQSTFQDFKPAAPLTWPGLLYMLAGFLSGIFAMWLLLTLFPRRVQIRI